MFSCAAVSPRMNPMNFGIATHSRPLHHVRFRSQADGKEPTPPRRWVTSSKRHLSSTTAPVVAHGHEAPETAPVQWNRLPHRVATEGLRLPACRGCHSSTRHRPCRFYDFGGLHLLGFPRHCFSRARSWDSLSLRSLPPPDEPASSPPSAFALAGCLSRLSSSVRPHPTGKPSQRIRRTSPAAR